MTDSNASDSDMNDSVLQAKAAGSGFNPLHCDWPNVVRFFRHLGMDLDFLHSPNPDEHMLTVPERFRPVHASQNNLTVRFSSFFRDRERPPNSLIIVAVKRRIIRMAAVLLLLPGMDLGKSQKWSRLGKNSYGWQTWVYHVRALCQLASIAVGKRTLAEDWNADPDATKLFSEIGHDDLHDGIANKDRIRYLDKRMSVALELGLIDDWISVDRARHAPHVLRPDPEGRKGGKLKGMEQNLIQPFKPEILTVILRTCIEVSNLTDDICSMVTAAGIQFGQKMTDSLKQSEFAKIVSDCEGTHISAGRLPYCIASSRGDRTIANILDHQLPRKFLISLATLVQTAHKQLLNFMFAARSAELSHLPFSAIEYRNDMDMHVLTGPFFKKAFGQHGDLRHWPVPDLAARSIERQRKLKTAIAKNCQPELLWWGNTYNLPNNYRYFWQHLRNRNDGSRILPENESTAPTRYRTSAAQLAALSLSGGTSVAKQILNHEDVSMTVGYVNATGDLHNQVLRLYNDVKAAFGKTILSDYADGALPLRSEGRVGKILEGLADFTGTSNAEGQYPPRPEVIPSAIAQIGTEDFKTIAAQLGQGARMTAPGVFCTRRSHETGKCADPVRTFNPGRCNDNKHCHFRLETAKYLQDQAHRIEDFLTMLDELQKRTPEMLHPESFTFHSIMIGLLDCFHHVKGPVAEKMRDPKIFRAVRMINSKMFEELSDDHRKSVTAIKNANREK